MPIRLGAVSYLNTRPLVYGLEKQTERFSVRFDVPARCAELLQEDQVDLGLIPSIEYPHGPDYRIVPDISIASDGPVASVTLFSKLPIERVRSVALDTSSRTSVALLRILCARRFEIAPSFVNMPPDVRRMLQDCDAALVIGDNALFAHVPANEKGYGRAVPLFGSPELEKIDLGEEWSGMTGLPFVYAFWAGRPGVIGPEDIATLQAARDRGVAATATIAQRCYPGSPEKAVLADRYLRENVKYALGEREQAGLQRFYEMAVDVGTVAQVRPPKFFG